MAPKNHEISTPKNFLRRINFSKEEIFTPNQKNRFSTKRNNFPNEKFFHNHPKRTNFPNKRTPYAFPPKKTVFWTKQFFILIRIKQYSKRKNFLMITEKKNLQTKNLLCLSKKCFWEWKSNFLHSCIKKQFFIFIWKNYLF